jgi:hypothetical protein
MSAVDEDALLADLDAARDRRNLNLALHDQGIAVADLAFDVNARTDGELLVGGLRRLLLGAPDVGNVAGLLVDAVDLFQDRGLGSLRDHAGARCHGLALGGFRLIASGLFSLFRHLALLVGVVRSVVVFAGFTITQGFEHQGLPSLLSSPRRGRGITNFRVPISPQESLSSMKTDI